jgi:hypothetical protein
MELVVTAKVNLKQEWTERHVDRMSVLTRAEEYAEWTLPSLFPRGNVKTETLEMQNAKDSLGAQGTNHLSNRVVDVMYPAPPRTFFRLELDAKMKKIATAALAAKTGSIDSASREVGKAMTELEELLSDTEKEAIKLQDGLMYRPMAIQTAKLLIVTGNAMPFHPPDNKPVQVYSMRDYVVQRDMSGEVILIMTHDMKAFETFNPSVQAQLRLIKRRDTTAYVDKTDVHIYTKIVLENDGKFHVYQQADEILLDTADASYPKDSLPWMPLTWNLIRGENYGRGLVEEYSGAFHALNVLTGALQNIAAVMGDIKIFADPASTVDVAEVNKSPPGSYHSGREGDIFVLQLDKLNDAQFIATMVARYEKMISQAFLLASAAVRQAERVTAEEIRAQAQELETSHGGIYSRLAAQWQRPTALLLLAAINFNGAALGVMPRVITGMESLSRLGELDALRMFFMDLAMLNNIPEDVRAVLHIPRLMTVLGTARQVDYKKFVKTDTELQDDQARLMAQQQAMIEAQERAKTGTAVATQVAKES